MALESTRKPHYAVMSFRRTKGGLAMDALTAASGERSALNLARRLAEARAGAVAFSRVGDPEFGEFEEPVELGRYGLVPDDVFDAAF